MGHLKTMTPEDIIVLPIEVTPSRLLQDVPKDLVNKKYKAFIANGEMVVLIAGWDCSSVVWPNGRRIHGHIDEDLCRIIAAYPNVPVDALMKSTMTKIKAPSVMSRGMTDLRSRSPRWFADNYNMTGIHPSDLLKDIDGFLDSIGKTALYMDDPENAKKFAHYVMTKHDGVIVGYTGRR